MKKLLTIAAIIATGLAVHAQTLVFNDTFDSGLGVATNDLNYNLAGRQTGSLALNGTYLDDVAYDNELTAAGELHTKIFPSTGDPGGGWEYMTGNMAPALASHSFSVEVTGKVLAGTHDKWSGFAVVDAINNNQTPMGFFLMQQEATHGHDIIYVYSGTDAVRYYFPIPLSVVEATLGASFSTHDLHTYEIEAFAESVTAGTWSLKVDGVTVVGGLSYEFSNSDVRYLEWYNNGVESLWDNVKVSAIPTPPKPEYVFIDTFNTANTNDINVDLDARQSQGLKSPAPYSLTTAGYSIVDNRLSQDGFVNWIWQEANLAPHIRGKDFELSAEVQVVSSQAEWTELYLHGQGENQDTSRFGVRIYGTGVSDIICTVFAGVDSSLTTDLYVTDFEAAIGGSYDRGTNHTYQLVSTAGNGITNSYDLVVDGITIRAGFEYAIGGGVDHIWMGLVKTIEAGSNVFYDDIYVKLIKAFTYEEWTVEEGLTAGVNDARTDDPDTDGMENLLEYALGGDPLLDDAASILPIFESNPSGLEYIYNRRRDAAERGLEYGLLVNTNGLQFLSAWTNVGHAFETTNVVIDLDFESVTNVVPTDPDAGFVKLEVTED